ncbi:hypothetical protein KTO58_11580 [Chitinophaga pendula]|uniref:hypothetical protein n=1 Tax=Chitinophaga pendula TaxID=2849666 RepID=UPI001CEC8D89|nr:hypothetical protein [Chitinophaga pendula]UCJ09808.1 hypothetical protein KTO58_11580 [Chitinophaga pendula]
MTENKKPGKELDKKANNEKEKNDSPIKPDPETLGPEPQEKMEGPVSSVIRKIAENGDEEDVDPEEQKKDAIDRSEEE